MKDYMKDFQPLLDKINENKDGFFLLVENPGNDLSVYMNEHITLHAMLSFIVNELKRHDELREVFFSHVFEEAFGNGDCDSSDDDLTVEMISNNRNPLLN